MDPGTVLPLRSHAAVHHLPTATCLAAHSLQTRVKSAIKGRPTGQLLHVQLSFGAGQFAINPTTESTRYIECVSF